MKKLLLLLVAILTSINLVKAQCDLNFDYVNTGSNMTAFFTPLAASAIHAELGDGTIGSFYTDADGSLICAASAAFNGAQIQLAVMADDSTSPDKDGFSSGESINWFYQTADGSIFSISPSPNENFTINGISFIQSSSISAIDCGGDDTTSDDECPPLDFNFLNTGSNMTLFVTSGDLLSDLGNGTVGVYFTDDNGDQICGGSASYTGGQVQIAANGDDATTTEKDGFSAGEAIVWKFEANDGSQYNLTPTPQDGFTLNATSFVFGMSYEAISCAVDVEGCTDELYIEYNPNASIDDGSCSIIAVYGCTDSDYVEYNSNANVDDGSCSTLIVNGCTDSDYVEYNPNANVDDGSCSTLIVNGCTDSNATNYDSNANTSDGSCEYDLIDAGCQVNFEYTNTGTNQTVFITPNATIGTPLSSGDQIGVFYISSTGEAISAGSSIWNGGQLQITAFGDDATTDDIDGLLVDAPLLLMAQSGDDVYIVTASYQTPNMSTYTTNGISFITGLDFELACTVEYLGCTDSSACNYDSTANTNDNSCVYPGDIYDCEGGCVNDADGDLVCDEFEVVGCQDESASNYDASATDAGECDYLGCTDPAYLEYDSSATLNDGSCSTLIVNGCTDSNATNYDSNANTSDGSCEYDLIDAGCQVNFEYTNTGTNQTVFITPNATIGTPLSSGDQIGVFYISSTGEAISAGSSIWNGGQLQITAFGDDATTDDIDGLLVDAPLLLMAQSGDDVYIVTASYQTPNMSTYTTNGISFITGLDFELACTVEYLGCTDSSACNYDSTANTNDNSCVYPGDIYDCEGGCVNDADGDLVCDEFEVVGCQDESASNYDASATDAGECISWEDAYESCLESGGDDGIGQEDVDAAYADGVASVDITSDNQAIADEAYGLGYGDGYIAGAASVTPEDGVSQSDLDAAVAEVQANAASQIAALEAEIENLLENSGDDGITQIDVDNAYLIGYSDGAASVTPEDGIGQADVDAAYADGVASVVCDPNAGYDIGYSDGAASVTPEDGIGQADVDAAYADGVASVDITSDNSTIADESYLFGYNDGVASAQADLDALQVLLDEAIANSGEGSCEPIYIDLLEGWNIMGYTLPNPQDVTATLASIVSNVQIVKNNSAAVYWPEYSFNGIGDFIPGQGYQIRMINALDNYTFPDVGSQRIELSPSVPEWVHELPVLNHPNDIRSLVRVVNMLGQEVDPSTQFKGEILLYLYNDGTTEKHIVN